MALKLAGTFGKVRSSFSVPDRLRGPSGVCRIVFVVAILGGACSGSPGLSSPGSAGAAPSPSVAASDDPVADDLAMLDTQVRKFHPDPFANNPESAWVAKLDELRTSLATATPDQRVVQLASLVGLLDTHSALLGPYDAYLHAYDVLLYPFSDGWFVVRAKDKALVGDRVVSISDRPIGEIEAALRPLVPADNESGELDGLQVISTVEYLHGLGIVDDPAKPAFVFAKPDGSAVTVDVTRSDLTTWGLSLDVVGRALSTKVRRRASSSTCATSVAGMGAW